LIEKKISIALVHRKKYSKKAESNRSLQMFIEANLTYIPVLSNTTQLERDKICPFL